jgi:hypothetical protein
VWAPSGARQTQFEHSLSGWIIASAIFPRPWRLLNLLSILRRRWRRFLRRGVRGREIDDHARGEITVVEIRVRFLERRHHLIDLVAKNASYIPDQLRERLRDAEMRLHRVERLLR